MIKVCFKIKNQTTFTNNNKLRNQNINIPKSLSNDS